MCNICVKKILNERLCVLSNFVQTGYHTTEPNQ